MNSGWIFDQFEIISVNNMAEGSLSPLSPGIPATPAGPPSPAGPGGPGVPSIASPEIIQYIARLGGNGCLES